MSTVFSVLLLLEVVLTHVDVNLGLESEGLLVLEESMEFMKSLV
jgi:hypothetical protein